MWRALLVLALVGRAHATPVARLPRTFSPTAVRARLALDDQRFVGHVDIDGELTDTTVWLHAHDLDILHATLTRGGATVALGTEEHGDDQMVALTGATPGRGTIAIDYTGQVHDAGRARLTHGVFRRLVAGRTYYFTQSEPTGAREIFPCLDEPGFKVPWQLTLDVPADGIALANAPLARETRLDARHLRFAFAPTLPLPSYLIAFAVGDFELVDGGTTRGGAPIRIAVERGDATRLGGLGDAIQAQLVRLEDYLETPYPYPKLDLVAVPQLGLGAMENAGLITFDRDLLGPWRLLEPVVAHELAHQWFGDLVTFAWWDDIWLAELFAANLPALAAGGGDGPIATSFLPLQPQVTTESLARWDVDYQHPMVRILEAVVGHEPLRRALQRYLRDHAHGVATSADLFAAIDAESGRHLAPAFATVAQAKGLPPIDIAHACVKGRGTLTLTRGTDPWPLPVCFSYGDAHGRVDRCVVLERERTALPAEGCPTWLLPGTGGVALFDTRGAAVGALATDGWSWLTAAERRFTLALTVVPEGELAVMAKLVDDGDLAPVVPRLAIIARDAPIALRPQVDAWILRTFGARGAALDLAALDDYPLASLLGHAGDARLVAQAIALAAVDGPHDYAVDDLAADRDRAYALKLFHAERRLLQQNNYQLLHALELSRLSVDLALADPHLLDGIAPDWRLRIMAAGCDAPHRTQILALFAHTAEQAEAARRCADRVALQQRLEPALRALIAR